MRDGLLCSISSSSFFSFFLVLSPPPPPSCFRHASSTSNLSRRTGCRSSAPVPCSRLCPGTWVLGQGGKSCARKNEEISAVEGNARRCREWAGPSLAAGGARSAPGLGWVGRGRSVTVFGRSAMWKAMQASSSGTFCIRLMFGSSHWHQPLPESRGDVVSAVQGRALVGDEGAEYVIMGEGRNLSRRRGTGAGWCPRSRPPVRHCLCPARGSRYPNARCHTRWKENPSRQSQCCLGPARGSRSPNDRSDTR